MQATLTPQPKALTLWRITLVAVAVVPAFLCSLFLRPGSGVWWMVSAFWVAVFLFLYLFYLPARFRKLSLVVGDDRFVWTSGVFYNNIRTVPFESIQFMRVRSSPLHRFFGISSLMVVSPGGGFSMAGLKVEEAERIVAVVL